MENNPCTQKASRQEIERALDAYFELSWRIFERVCADPVEYERMLKILEKHRSNQN